MANLDLTYQETQEIKQLSLEFLGSSSRWQKIIEKGSVVHLKDSEGKNVLTEGNIVLGRIERQSARDLLQNLREAKAVVEAQKEERRKLQETMRAAQLASGSVGE